MISYNVVVVTNVFYGQVSYHCHAILLYLLSDGLMLDENYT